MYLMLVLVLITSRTTAMYTSSSVLPGISNTVYRYTNEKHFLAKRCFVQVRKDEFSAYDVAKR
jgi:hypothetical protein